MPNGAARRQTALRVRFTTDHLQGLIVSGSANIRYLTGFSGSAGLLLVTESRAVLVTDFRYASQAAAEVGPAAEIRIERSNLWEGVRSAIQSEGLRRIGVNKARTTLAEMAELEQVQAEWVPTKGLVEELRWSKDRTEIDTVRQAASLAAEALTEILPMVRPGRTEIDVAASLEFALRSRGSEWHPFQPIVASGARSALPHARASCKVIGQGDLLVIDFGAPTSTAARA